MRDSELKANRDLQRPQDSPNWHQGRGPNRDPSNDRKVVIGLALWVIGALGSVAAVAWFLGRCS